MVVVYRNEKNELIACGHIKNVHIIDDMLHFTKDDNDGFGRVGKIVEVIDNEENINRCIGMVGVV